jgi:hypothetical protein
MSKRLVEDEAAKWTAERESGAPRQATSATPPLGRRRFAVMTNQESLLTPLEGTAALLAHAEAVPAVRRPKPVFDPLTSRPEMAPQRFENTGFVPGNGWASGCLHPQNLGPAARRWSRRGPLSARRGTNGLHLLIKLRANSPMELAPQGVGKAGFGDGNGMISQRRDTQDLGAHRRRRLGRGSVGRGHRFWHRVATLRQILAPKRLKSLSRCQNCRCSFRRSRTAAVFPSSTAETRLAGTSLKGDPYIR